VTGGHRFTHARATILIVALCVLGSSAVAGAAHPARADTAAQLKSAEAKLASITARMQAAAKERDALQAQLTTLFVQVDANRHALEATASQIAAVQGAMARLARGIVAQQAALDRWAANAYIGGPGSGVEMILGATSPTDLQERVVFVGAVAQSEQDLITSLTGQRGRLAVRRSQLETLQANLTSARDRLNAEVATLNATFARQRAAIASLARDQASAETLVKQLKTKRQREIQLAKIRKAQGSPPPNPAPPPNPGPGGGSVQSLIASYFGPQGQNTVRIALCVAYHESGYNPNAQNPSSGAAGVFQFMPSSWAGFSQAAGWGGANVFDGRANVAVAAWVVSNYGWSPWRADWGACGI
jgi:peptidoglycan hydrolase CwlO-like protein